MADQRESTAVEADALCRQLSDKIAERVAVVGVIGLGYVGLPLAVLSGLAGFRTIGFDVDAEKLPRLNNGRSYIDAVRDEELAELVGAEKFCATDDFNRLAECDVIIVCVPTPLTRQREPDLSFVQATAHEIALRLRKGQLVVLESTSYPGTTREIFKPILEAAGLRSGEDFLLGYSPEREDPGNQDYSAATIPKIVAGDGDIAARAAEAFYGALMKKVVVVSSPDVAEAVKITENVFRAVNIALVNELKMIFDRMGIDVWEVIEAAKTKPFGYMPFYPGPGLGGHCIPIDPFYLTWKSREYDINTRFIELAGEINVGMPRYVVGKVQEALNLRFSKSLSICRVLILGLAYKKNVSDIRESPSLKLIGLLEESGARVDFHDPHVSTITTTRGHAHLEGRQSVAIDSTTITFYDAVIIATDHDVVDYASIVSHARLIIDTRNVCSRLGITSHIIVKA